MDKSKKTPGPKPHRRDKAIALMMEGVPPAQAALAAGYKPSTAVALVDLNRPEFTKKLREALQEEGVTPPYVAKGLKAGMEAMKTVSLQFAHIRTDLPDADAHSDDFVDVPDWRERKSYFELALKYLAITEPKELSIALNTSVQVNVVTPAQSQEMAIAELISAGRLVRRGNEYVLREG